MFRSKLSAITSLINQNFLVLGPETNFLVFARRGFGFYVNTLKLFFYFIDPNLKDRIKGFKHPKFTRQKTDECTRRYTALIKRFRFKIFIGCQQMTRVHWHFRVCTVYQSMYLPRLKVQLPTRKVLRVFKDVRGIYEWNLNYVHFEFEEKLWSFVAASSWQNR